MVDALDKLQLKSLKISLKEGANKSSNYSSVCVLNDSTIVCRICFRKKTFYLSVPSAFYAGKEFGAQSAENGYFKIPIHSEEEILEYKDILCSVLTCIVNSFLVEFGCCSRYVECSDARKCIHPDAEMAVKCAYRNNLLNGRVFYGQYKNI